ncbi:MAG: RluA family pseudouridine synthase [Bacteriovoracaceae bacterium]|nr:RluA family pseudouridine synthase [Bacteriovoracaceae bacterium]
MIIEKDFQIDKYVSTYPVMERHEGIRLDQFIGEFFPSFSRQFIKKNIAEGAVVISSPQHQRPHPHRASTKIHLGERITMTIHKSDHNDNYFRGQKIELQDTEIVYEDDDIIVISKPPFMAAHPTGRHLFFCATVVLEHMLGHKVYSCHRLDRETSGVLVLGKNPKAASLLSQAFEENLNKKCYFFIANKELDNDFPFTATEKLGRNETGPIDSLERLMMITYPQNSRHGKWAETKYQLLWEDDGYVLGLAFPKTGRQHQIRVHAAYHGIPLLGDKVYHGGMDMFCRLKDDIAYEDEYDLIQIPRHALHALALNVPYKGYRKTFQSKIPDDLKDWIAINLELDFDSIERKITKFLRSEFESLSLT